MEEFVSPLEDTIVACATARGKAGVAVVRLSGAKALSIAKKLCPAREAWPSHLLRTVRIVADDGQLVDQGMAVAMVAPHSFTGEDVVELHVHGSPAIIAAVESAACSAGARMATPGEFSRRAFVYGKMSLADAEALGALLDANDALSHRAAIAQVASGLVPEVRRWLGELEKLLARCFAALDFPEYVPEEVLRPDDLALVRTLTDDIERWRNAGLVLSERRWDVVLAGASNIGKSTLFNALLGEERALIDDAPGTTRDRISAHLSLGGHRVNVSDTAGVRDEATGVEARGVLLTQSAVASAQRVVWLVDPSLPVWPAGASASFALYGARADRASESARAALEDEARQRAIPLEGWVSGRTGEGVAALRKRLVAERAAHDDALANAFAGNERWLAQARHLSLLRSAEVALTSAASHLDAQAPLDLVALEVREATAALGQILGRDVAGEVLEQIFAQFCIGK